MFANFIKLSLRHLWRQRLFTALNIVGLAVGISACWIVYLIVRHEFSFEEGIAGKDRIYHVVSRFIFDGKETGNAGAPTPMVDAMRSEVPGVEMVVPVQGNFVQKVTIPVGQDLPPLVFEMQKKVSSTTSQYFQLVPYQWLAGNPADFDMPGKVVLLSDRAANYFPNLTPDQVLGRSLAYNDTLMATVAGVVAPLPFPSDFDAEEFVSMGTLQPLHAKNPHAWAGVNSDKQIFFRIAPGADLAAMTATINRISSERAAEDMKRWGMDNHRWHLLQPLTAMHFEGDYADHHRKADMTILYSVMGVAAFLLLLACINFINLTTAQLPQRAKELGIRKTLGSGSRALIGQLLAETFLTGLLAVGLAFVLVRLFLRNFDEYIPEGMQGYPHVLQTLAFLLGLLVVISLLSGLYPGWLATKVQPARILRGQTVAVVGKQRVTLRKGLIVFQFTAAQLFMLAALVVGSQLHFVLHHDLGFHRDAVLTASVPIKVLMKDSDKGRCFTLSNELQHLPGVASVSLGEPPMTGSYSANFYHLMDNPSEQIQIARKYVDTSYLSLYDLKLLAGRNLYPSDTVREYLINATCAQALGFQQPSEALGHLLSEGPDGPAPAPIVGVLQDFHIKPFSEKIEPIVVMCDKESLSDFNIRLASARPEDWQDAIAAVGAVWSKIYPEEAFKPEFYDETVAKMYESELLMGRMINLTMAVAILISCLGLFGLATLTAFQRTKEVGVRKVLGASAASVVALLSKDFLKLVLLALVLAAPVAWWLMNKWLQGFAYRVEMSGWMVATVGATAVAVAFLTVSYQSLRAAFANPVKSLRSE